MGIWGKSRNEGESSAEPDLNERVEARTPESDLGIGDVVTLNQEALAHAARRLHTSYKAGDFNGNFEVLNLTSDGMVELESLTKSGVVINCEARGLIKIREDNQHSTASTSS